MLNFREIIEEDNRLLQLLEISFNKEYPKGLNPAGGSRGLGRGGDKFLGHEIPPETTHLAVSGPPVSPQPPGYAPLEKEDWLALKPGDTVFCWTREGEEKWYDVIRNDQGNILVYDKEASIAAGKTIKTQVQFLPNFWHKMD
jgi:hypothetical protein